MPEDIQSIEKQIAEADERKAALQAELEQRMTAARESFVSEVRINAKNIGMPIEDLIQALGGRTPAASTKTRKPRQARVLKSDLSKVYKGGAVPGWMKTKMTEFGFHTADKDERAKFIAEHMQAA